MTSKEDTYETKGEAQVEEVKGVATAEQQTKNTKPPKDTGFDEDTLKYMVSFDQILIIMTNSYFHFFLRTGLEAIFNLNALRVHFQ